MLVLIVGTQFKRRLMENVYTPPQADLKKDDQNTGQYGSVEKAICGDWDFAIGETISEAWSLVRGTKGSFFVASLIYIILAVVISLIPEFLSPISGGFLFFLVNILNLVLNIAIIPLTIGIMMMGVSRQRLRFLVVQKTPPL